MEDQAVTNFRNYLRIPSVHQHVDYTECIKFIRNQALSMNLMSTVYKVDDGQPIILITYPGRDSTLSTVLLNSHMDVVPAHAEMWKHPPFEAVKEVNGDIYGRGAQDMKSIGIQYLETIRRYCKEGLKFDRTIYLSFVPDEEIPNTGMSKFVLTPEFADLNVGIALDEGRVNETDTHCVYYGERQLSGLDVVCTGQAGHGSMLIENTAGEKLHYMMDRLMDLRQSEKQKIQQPEVGLSDVTTINLTKLKGGQLQNVVPSELTATFDVRIPLTDTVAGFRDKVDKWCTEAGDGVYTRYYHEIQDIATTATDSTNPWWVAFEDEMKKMGLKVKKSVSPGATDSKYIRQRGIPAFGFNPATHTPIRLHDHNEFLNEREFLRGIDIYYNLVKRLASL